MISYFKKQIQNKINTKNDSRRSSTSSRNGSVSCGNINQFTEESIRKGPLSDFVFKEKYGYPLEKSQFQFNLKESLSHDLSRRYFVHFLQIKGFYNVYNIMLNIDSILKTGCDKYEPGNINGNVNDVHCDILEIWNLCKEEESQGRLNTIPESLHKHMQNLKTELKEPKTKNLNNIEDKRTINNSVGDVQINNGLPDTDPQLKVLYDLTVQSLEIQLAEFSKSELYCKYQVEIFTSDTITLSDMLCHPTGLPYFMEYLEEENCQNVLEFWLAVTNFERLLSECSNTSEESQNDAILIYDKYLSLQATSPLGFSNKIRYETELAICDESGLKPNCFESALSVVLAFLRYQLDQFTSSQHFDRLLSDIIGSCRKISPCSSMSSISTESSSLMGATSMCKKSQHVRGLSFGRIDQLGRFDSAVHHEPNRKESAISKVMKKLTNKDKEAEEEMAWKVAEKIVKNVTTLTMGDGDVESDDES